MKEVIGRIEVLLLIMVIVASCLLIPATKPHVSLQQAATTAIDNVIYLNQDCEADLLDKMSTADAYRAIFDKYTRRMYSEEAGASAREKWLLISPISMAVVIDLRARIPATWVSHHDLWNDDEQGSFGGCSNFLTAVDDATSDVLRAYYYTGATTPASTALVDLDAKFDSTFKVPYLDGAFSLPVVLRLVFAIVAVTMIYLIVLLRSLSEVRVPRADYGALLLAQPGWIAITLSSVWVASPCVIYAYTVAADMGHGTEAIGLAIAMAALNVWLLWEIWRFRRRALR